MMQRHLLSLSILAVLSPYAIATDTTAEHQLDTIELQADYQQADTIRQSSGSSKFSHDVLNVPFSRSLVDQNFIQHQDVQRVDDALNMVSGVFRQTDYGGGFWDNYAIRGFNTDPDMGATTVRNGLSASRGINAPKDMVNVQSLDFLKGAGAAIYGRGEAGGVLNLNTKKPQWTEHNELNVRLNSLGKYRTSIEHTAPANDHLAYRLAIAAEKNQSFRDYVENERLFFSPQLTWNVSDRTTLELDNEFLYQAGIFDRGISAVNKQITMHRSTYTGEPREDKNKLTDQFNQIQLNHQFNDAWKLNSALSYKRTTIEGTSTEPRRMLADGNTLLRFRRQRDNASQDVQLQLDLLGKIHGKIEQDVLISLEGGRLQYRQKLLRRNPSFDRSTGQWLYGNPIDIRRNMQQYNANVYQLTESNQNENYQDQHTYFAANVQNQTFWTPKLSTLIGGRFDYVEQHFENYNPRSYPTLVTDLNANHHRFSPRFGVNYQLNDQVSVYANYGRSFAMNSRVDRFGQLFKPEYSQNTEVGVKYTLADRGLVSLVLFDTKKQNILTLDPATDGATSLAAGEARSKGVELDLAYQANERLNVQANYSYTDAKITQDADPNLVNTRLSNVAKHRGAIAFNYDLVQREGRVAGFGGQWIYVGERSGHYIDNGFNLPAYHLLNAHAYYAPSDRLRYQLNVHNILNKTYYTASYSDLWIQAGEPINASLAVQWKF